MAPTPAARADIHRRRENHAPIPWWPQQPSASAPAVAAHGPKKSPHRKPAPRPPRAKAKAAPAPGPARAGRVALIGRPNVGKSTLLNAALEQRLSIVSPTP